MVINAVLFGVEEKVRNTLNPKYPTKDSKNQHHKPCLEYYKMFAISGATAGLIQSFLLSPIELVKIKMQLPNCQYASTWHCAQELFSRHGYKYLTRGTCLTIVRDVPAISSYFIGFEFICNSFTTCRDNLTVVNLLVAGGFAGCLSWLITYPIDVVKTRYQADPSYTGIRDCVRKTLRTEGQMVFWRGLAPTLLR
jgi:solute carrier family 25 carnitine/acylcarnitine transporter 20/29